jgi:hypothetical protein
LDYASYAAAISFRFVDPDAGRDEFERFAVERAPGDSPRLIELPYTPFDVHNTVLPQTDADVIRALRGLCEIPRMSSFAIGALLNRAVARMPAGQAFVNVGVWNGFTLLSGIACNPGKLCIGVDNFSEGPGNRTRLALAERFEPHAGADRRFHELDYRDYFEQVHREPIGVYLYDGEHSYENQLAGLEIAEPFLAPGCLVLVDDTNWSAAHEGTVDFMQTSVHEWELLLDRPTGTNAHPTYSNGLMVLQLTRRADAVGGEVTRTREQPPTKNVRSEIAVTPPPIAPSRDGARAPLVSVVVVNEDDRATGLEQAIEGYLGQSWPRVEVLVADEAPSEHSRRAVAAFPGLARLEPSLDAAQTRSAREEAVAASGGDFLGFAEAGRPVRRDAVTMALAFPGRTGRGRELPEDRWTWMERALAASEDLSRVVPKGEAFVLLNDSVWNPDVVPERRPLLGADGGRTGGPADEEEAIARLEGMRAGGASFVAFAWPAFWWLERFPRLHLHLTSSYRCVLRNERVVVFDVRSE